MPGPAVVDVGWVLANITVKAVPVWRSERSLMAGLIANGRAQPSITPSSHEFMENLSVLKSLAEQTELSPSDRLWDDDLVVAGYYAIRAAYLGEHASLAAAASRLFSSAAELARSCDDASATVARVEVFESSLHELLGSGDRLGWSSAEVERWVARHVQVWDPDA
jgi:hypothetical protein